MSLRISSAMIPLVYTSFILNVQLLAKHIPSHVLAEGAFTATRRAEASSPITDLTLPQLTSCRHFAERGWLATEGPHTTGATWCLRSSWGPPI